MAKLPPGPQWSRLQSMRAFRDDPVQYLAALSENYGDFVYVPVFHAPVVLMRLPQHFRHVLSTHRERYVRGRRLAAFKPVFGEGLMLAEGAAWKAQRQLMQPLMSRSAIRSALPLFIARTQGMIDRIQANGQVIDIGTECERLSLEIAIDAMFRGTSGHDTATFRSSIEYLNGAMNAEVAAARVPRWVPTAANRRFLRSVATIRSFIEEIIRQHQGNDKAEDGLLSGLMGAADERGSAMSDSLLRDQATTLLVAGFETTALALTWSFYLMSAQPHVYKLLQEEADMVESPIDATDLPYACAIVKEAMRLFPPAWAVSRTARVEDEIDGFRIPKGATIVLSILLLHRDARYWDDPEEFRPERFLAEVQPAPAKDTYLPFSTGARRCIGEHYATLQTAVVLWLIAKKLDLISRPQSVGMRGMLTLRPASPVLCELMPRQ